MKPDKDTKKEKEKGKAESGKEEEKKSKKESSKDEKTKKEKEKKKDGEKEECKKVSEVFEKRDKAVNREYSEWRCEDYMGLKVQLVVPKYEMLPFFSLPILVSKNTPFYIVEL